MVGFHSHTKQGSQRKDSSPCPQAEEQSVKPPNSLWKQEKDRERNPAQRSSFLVMPWLFQRPCVTAR
ncbi:mCG142068 [Mus musculus]|nr:mCG142068 [Mus musculus]